MINTEMTKKDECLMQLAHYFITKEGYTPMVVRGTEGEIWLENIEAPYKIIRLNTNYIHNDEQLDFDMFKIKNIVRQVKRKTLSFSVKTLNILMDVGSNVNMHNGDKIDCIKIDPKKGVVKSKYLNELYPDLKENIVSSEGDTFNFLIHVTDDINHKAQKENMEFEKVFSKKKVPITYFLIALNALVFILGNIGIMTNSFDLYTMFALHRSYVQSGEIWRLLTAAFTHQSIIHFGLNMYALYIIGTQTETYLGRWKYLAIYIFSAIMGCLLSCVINTGWSLGASGAIFGLMGSLLYFGYHYRLYLDSALRTQILPLIITNLVLGFLIPGVDNAGHIGGLIGGILMSMAVGVENRSSKTDRINGTICSIILFAFLIYLVLFAK